MVHYQATNRSQKSPDAEHAPHKVIVIDKHKARNRGVVQGTLDDRFNLDPSLRCTKNDPKSAGFARSCKTNDG